MKFIDRPAADASIDLVCRMCPMHLMEASEKIEHLAPGQVLEILTDYDGALEDIPAWCRTSGQDFLGMESSDECYRLYVRKGQGN